VLSTSSRPFRQAEFKPNRSKSSASLGYVRTDREVGPVYILSGLLDAPQVTVPLARATAQKLLPNVPEFVFFVDDLGG
jgi:hypothetical protein